MRLNRFFGNFNLTGEIVSSSDEELINQLKNVLRMKAGNEVVLCDGKLNEALCMIEDLSKAGVVSKIMNVYKNEKEFKSDIVFYCSILKRENFELAIQKAVELGVKKIVPVIASRTVKFGLKRDRLEKIIKEASEQSGRGILPILSDSLGFGDAVADAAGNDINLFFELGGSPLDQLKPDLIRFKKIGVFIGPEGGWGKEEVDLADASNFKKISLSPFTLRGETAAIAGVAVITQQLQ